MKTYLAKILDWQSEEVVNQYDELPLWSSPFGTLLLDNFPIGAYEQYLDIGCGTGFPLIDISQRLGSQCKAYGIDPWHAAIKRARTKIETIGLRNIELIEEDASILPFQDERFDLVTSNLGINNFDNPLAVLTACHRVMKTGASFCATTNLNGTFQEFYDVFEKTLTELGLANKYEAEYSAHVNHRGTIRSMRKLLETGGFNIVKQIESSYQMRFLNGSAFLNYSVVIVGFIYPWRTMFDEEDKHIFFERFENNLNEYSKINGELKLTIPMAYFECRK
ncbi:MAG: class I SAM-dependent methyltransferase [Anaerolineaceae bacterium]|nr:class I SAM-dependent methyltransferase [Anaerolineaceae bacterium]